MVKVTNFKDFLLDHRNIDTIIIGYFLAEAISAFYTSSFDSVVTPIIDRILPGEDNKPFNFFGTKLYLHRFIVGIVRLIFSIYLAFILRKMLFTIKNN